MDTIKFTEAPSKQGLAFKFFMIISIVILFGLVLYAILGPLPSQSKFLKKSSDGNNNLTVLGDTALNGNLVVGANTQMNGFLNIDGNTRVGDVLTVNEIDLITSLAGIDTLQGSLLAQSSGLVSLNANTSVSIKDLSGTNTVAKFTVESKQSDFYGDVVVNDLDGTSALVLKNQSGSLPSYELFNDSTGNDNFVLQSKNVSTIRKLFEANSNGTEITLSNANILTNPLVRINGPSGFGQVYDSQYNPVPSIGSNPTLLGLTVNGIANFTSDSNFTSLVNVTGVLKATNNATSLSTTDFYQNITRGGSLTINTIDDFFVQGKSSVNISALSNVNYIASFDTSLGQNIRSNATVPAMNLKGYMKYTLPTYGIISGNQVNSYTYITSTNSTIASTTTPPPIYINGWPYYPGLGSCNITGWASSQPTAMNLIITTAGTYQGGWVCPKRGIWQVTFDSGLNGIDNTNFSFGIGNIGPSSSPFSFPNPYGLNKVSTTVVINQNDIILPSANYCSGGGIHIAATMPAFMIFSLIMELNTATTT
jgi:hypothetical protein